MSDVLPSQLITSVMAKLYDVLTNGDETVPPSEDNFFSWATPGIPVEASDFDFLAQGLTGVVKREAIAELSTPPPAPAGTPAPGTAAPAAPPAVELTAALLDQLRAQDTARLYAQAEQLARLVDFVPDVTSADGKQFARLSVLNNEGSLSDIYRYVLRMSQVMHTELPTDTKEKIEKLRNLLTVTTKKKNLIDDTEVEVAEPSPLSKAYFDKMAAYEAAALEYNSRRVDALTAAESRAVHFWAMNANILRNKVRHALNDWTSAGYKSEYEQIAAYINQVTERDMKLLKEEYKDDLEKARLTGLSSGSDFFYTALAPGNFARSNGWTEFRFNSGDFETHTSSNASTKAWQAQASARYLGIFGGSGGASSSSTKAEFKSSFKSSHVSLSFQIAQVPIVRPWFKPAFLLSKSWRFDQAQPEAKDEMISDGQKPSKGLMPAYPTMVIFIKNLRFSLGESSGLRDFMVEHTSTSAGGGGSVNIGPFHAGGSYSRAATNNSTQGNNEYRWNGQELIVEGMQIIGFKCHLMPKSPDPLPTITSWA